MSTPKEKFMDFFMLRELRPESTSSGSGGAASQKVLKVESLQKRFFDAINAQERKAKVQKELDDLLKALDELQEANEKAFSKRTPQKQAEITKVFENAKRSIESRRKEALEAFEKYKSDLESRENENVFNPELNSDSDKTAEVDDTVLNVEDSDPTKNVKFSTDQENEAKGLGENRTFSNIFLSSEDERQRHVRKNQRRREMQIAQLKFQARQKERQLEEEKIQLQEKLELLQMQDNFDEEFPDESLKFSQEFASKAKTAKAGTKESTFGESDDVRNSNFSSGNNCKSSQRPSGTAKSWDKIKVNPDGWGESDCSDIECLETPQGEGHKTPNSSKVNDKIRSENLASGSRGKTTSSRSLPKWKLTEFSGDPLDWPEWSGMFLSTIGNTDLTNDEKMNYLKGYLRGTAQRAVKGLGYTGAMYDVAWATLQRKFGQPHLIISAQLVKVSTFPNIRIHDSTAIVEFADILSSFVNVLQQFRYNNDLYSSTNLELAVSKLPPDLRKNWYKFVQGNDIQQPNMLQLNSWLQDESDVHERLIQSGNVKTKTDNNFPKNANSKNKQSTFGAQTSGCPMGDGEHRLDKCQKFQKMNLKEKYDFVKNNRLCFCCLTEKHISKDCKSKPCDIDNCGRRHHKLLHFKSKPKDSPVNTTVTQTSIATRGLLQIAKVRIFVGSNSWDVLAVCDTGSTKTWIDASLCERMGVEGKPSNISVIGIHGAGEIQSNTVNIRIGSPTFHELEPLEVEASTHPVLEVGDSTYDYKNWKKRFAHLKPLPSITFTLSDVKLILGQDCYPLIRPLEYQWESYKLPWAVRIPLGWTISGPLPSAEKHSCTQIVCNANAGDVELAQQIHKWWDMESYSTKCSVKSRSKADQRAEDVLKKTTKFNGSRYEVGLLWAEDDAHVPNNFPSAMSQFTALERRLQKNSSLADKYTDSIQTDIDKGYIRKVDNEELNATRELRQWYLPHHPVVNPHKPEKVRRVCNAASKHAGKSLNDALVAGPDLLQSLIGVLFRFREKPIAISADIEAMFLQVEVPEGDQRCLRLLWRDQNNAPISVYQYTRHIFGAKSSPTCANWALRQCGKDHIQNFPLAAKCVEENFYMDDLLKSCSNIEEAANLAQDLTAMLGRGGFNLTKWTSNDKSLNQLLPGNVNNLEKQSVQLGGEQQSLLGLQWDITEDKLRICRGLKVKSSDKWTHRKILSTVSGVFDPIGLAAPYTIRARILLKEIWTDQGQQWDKLVNDSFNKRFQEWVDELPELEQLTINRYYLNASNANSTQLHIFADASQEAFSIVCYLLFEQEGGTRSLSYVIGKSRVAPIKYMTIPKLELQAAMTAVRLKNTLVLEHRLNIDSIIFWSDSSTVIQWIKNSTKKQPVFVANRVAEILESTSVDQWRHVPGEQNPADYGTRGLTVSSLKESTWLTGPAWLLDEENKWPQTMPLADEATSEETQLLVSHQSSLLDWERYSSFSKVINIIARILRLFKNKECKTVGLQPGELLKAEEKYWMLVQRDLYKKDIPLIEKGNVGISSELKQLCPFIDSSRLLRSRGRLGKSILGYDSKHPIILNAKHSGTKLYLEHVHKKNHHEGVEYLKSIVQQRFWITGIRNCLRAIRHSCVQCRKLNAKPETPLMAGLPPERMAMKCYPFEYTGIDYFGPFEVRFLRRTLKRWCCIFTCLTTRAVHIEVAQSLDTDSCLQAISRFIARRGKPREIWSDNGTNFVGANREFREYINNWNQNCIEEQLSQDQIVWKFNPPGAPHFGGVWERLIRSCKKAMINILGSRRLTDETLNTTMCMVEQVLNARPLTPVSNDPNDMEALTPNHFLIGRPNVNLPKCIHSATNMDYRKAYRNSELYTDLIWQRWLKEYIPQFNVRQKWFKESDEQLAVGDLVWIVNADLKRSQFELGRVKEIYMASDGNVRSALIRTTKGEYKRPVVKLIPLGVHGTVSVSTPVSEHGAGDVADDLGILN